jgi:hypothetical protein
VERYLEARATGANLSKLTIQDLQDRGF